MNFKERFPETDEIWDYSNPHIVYRKAKEYFGDDVDLRLSTRKEKKYMIFNPNTDKWVHFGQLYMEDYTHHKNNDRLNNFRIRNHKWKDADRYTPAYLSYVLLW